MTRLQPSPSFGGEFIQRHSHGSTVLEVRLVLGIMEFGCEKCKTEGQSRLFRVCVDQELGRIKAEGDVG